VTKLKIFSLLLICSILFYGCAFHNGDLGENHSSPLCIELFHNDSFQPGLEEKLTKIIVEEFLADGRVPIVNDNDSELTMKGIIKSYTRTILTVDGNDNVSLYQLAITVDLNVLNTQTSETISHNQSIQVTTTYVPQRSNIEFETESVAQKRLLEDLAEEIVYQLLDKDKKIKNFSAIKKN
jgi:hypothetical protein